MEKLQQIISSANLTKKSILNFKEELKKKYNLPENVIDTLFKYKKKKYCFNNKCIILTNYKLEPYSFWIHDEQIDDILSTIHLKRLKTVEDLKKLPYVEQHSKEWFEGRQTCFSATAIASLLNMSDYQQAIEIIMDKTGYYQFTTNENCYHGTKYEEVASMIYCLRNNVSVYEFGLIKHKNYDFIGASPDRIVSEYKYNKINKTNLIGRMIEIKVPPKRKIKVNESEIYDCVCPKNYWTQVQTQLEVCDLDETDFWQLNITEYKTKQDYLNDTRTEYFRTKDNMEKGMLIQLIKREFSNNITDEIIYSRSKFMYPPKIEMSFVEYNNWLVEQLQKIPNDYVFDRIIYWRINETKCVTIQRDRQWFNNNLPIFRKFWNYILFLRNNKNILIPFMEQVKSAIDGKKKVGKRINDKFINLLDDLYNNRTSIKLLPKNISVNVEDDEEEPPRQKSNIDISKVNLDNID